MMSWKTILALAVLAAPLAWCEAEIAGIEACAKAGGAWSNSWRGYCRMGDEQ